MANFICVKKRRHFPDSTLTGTYVLFPTPPHSPTQTRAGGNRGSEKSSRTRKSLQTVRVEFRYGPNVPLNQRVSESASFWCAGWLQERRVFASKILSQSFIITVRPATTDPLGCGLVPLQFHDDDGGIKTTCLRTAATWRQTNLTSTVLEAEGEKLTSTAELLLATEGRRGDGRRQGNV